MTSSAAKPLSEYLENFLKWAFSQAPMCRFSIFTLMAMNRFFSLPLKWYTEHKHRSLRKMLILEENVKLYIYMWPDRSENSTSLWHSINIFPENFNTNMLSHAFCNSSQRLSFEYNRSVQFIFQLAPNLLDGVEVWTLRGPVHHFQCSSRILSITGSSGNSSFYGYFNGQFTKLLLYKIKIIKLYLFYNQYNYNLLRNIYTFYTVNLNWLTLLLYYIWWIPMVCVCVVVNPMLWGQNVPTKMAISKILVLVGTFFGPHEETSLYIIKNDVFSNLKMHKVFCKG